MDNKRQQPDLSVGAIWNRQGTKQEYLSIKIDLVKLMKAVGPNAESCNLVAFTNRNKKGEKSPDMVILPSNRDTKNAGAPAASTRTSQPVKPAKSATPVHPASTGAKSPF
jgi:hypothetical protein